MANYEKRINCMISHGIKLSLDILAQSVGVTSSEYCRGILVNFFGGIDLHHPPVLLDRKPDLSTWERVAYVIKTNGPDFQITFRMTDSLFDAVNEAAVYNRSSFIRTLFLAHIYANIPRLPLQRAMEQAEILKNLIEIIKKHKENKPPIS